MKANAELLAGLAAHLLLIGAPGVAAALYGVRRGMKEVPLILGLALVASGVTAFAGFWAYYADSLAGQTWTFLLFFGSVLAIGWCWRAGGLDRAVLRQLATPLALWVLGSCFVVFLGFLHGGVDNPIPMSALRFSFQLPSDNDIPRYFAEWFSTHGHQNPPPVYPPDWLMSDRPPLQIGYVLSERGFFNTAGGLHYEILCVIVQSLWIVGMWAVLLAARLRARTRALAMFAAMVSDIAIVHGFFVWPKLIAAAFLLAALAIVISPAWRRDRLDIRVGALVGALLALAMLSHGSSIFGVIPLVLLAVLRGVPSWRWLGVAVAAGLMLMVPWMAYQHYADPPGNRLLKWQLGGDITLDSKGTLEAIEDGYSEVGFDGAVDLKEENFGEMVGWPRTKDEYESATDALDEGKPGIAAAKVRAVRFFSLLPFLGLLLIGPLAMLFARLRGSPRDEADWRFALVSFAFFGIACVAWGLLLFGTPDSRATIHVGSLAVPLLGVVGCVAGLRACYPRLAAWVVGLNVLFVLALYTPSLEPPVGSSYSLLTGLLAAASLAGLAFVTFRSGDGGAVAWPSGLFTTANLTRLRAMISRRLFPAGEGGPRFGRLEAAVLVVALLVLAVLLNLLRIGLSDSLNTVWAEDGPIYLQGALTQGFWHAVFSPYAGYLVVVPRLIGEAGAVVPLRYAPAAISIVSALVAGLSGLAVWFASGGHVRDPYLRGALAIATVLAATAGQETLDSAAYAPWFMLAAAFWLLFWRPRSLAGAALGALFLLMTGLSTPGVWFFLPVALLRAAAVRDRRDAILLGGYGLGALVQVPVVMGQEQGQGLWTSHIWTGYLQRVLDGGVFGQRLGGGLWEHFGWSFLVLFCLVLLAALVVGLWRTTPSARWFAAAAIPTSALMFFVSVYQRTVADNIFWSAGGSGGTASRYVMVPALLLLSALLVVLDGVVRREGQRRWRWWLVAPAVGVVLLATAVSFDMSSSVRGRPYWEDALRAAADKCVAKDEEVAGIASAPAPWGVQVPCSQVASYAGEGVGESSGR